MEIHDIVCFSIQQKHVQSQVKFFKNIGILFKKLASIISKQQLDVFIYDFTNSEY